MRPDCKGSDRGYQMRLVKSGRTSRFGSGTVALVHQEDYCTLNTPCCLRTHLNETGDGKTTTRLIHPAVLEEQGYQCLR
jgi:hypothetical protein